MGQSLFDRHQAYSVVLDTDPGADDVVAISILAPELRRMPCFLLPCFGNDSLEKTADNLSGLAAALGLRGPVIAGASGPATDEGPAEWPTRHHTLRKYLPEKGIQTVYSDDFIDKLADFLREQGRSIYILLGPMTNLRLLLDRYPEAAGWIAAVVVMGGGIDHGNVGPFAEFNIYCDPMSARLCFARRDLTFYLAPLDTAEQVVLSKERIDRMVGKAGPVAARAVGGAFALSYESSTRHGFAGSVIYDAAATALCIDPSLFTLEAHGLTVQTEGEQVGRTVLLPEGENVQVITAIDQTGLFDLMEQRIALL